MTRSVALDPYRGRAAARYQLKEQLAVGGMGIIHRAYDRLAQREVAYKRLRVVDESSRVRVTALFQREYDTLAKLPHPNIVEVYDYGQDDYGPYYVMELLRGKDLTDLAPLPVRETCRVLRDIASALALVHARKLIHRDISPNNIRLTNDGRAKLIDFGALTAFGKAKELVGTPPFIAPECLTDGELDQRSDLYSLGAVAYWTLTRKLAVRARSLEALIDALGEPLEAPSVHVAGIPTELDQLVLSLLAKERVARPPSAADVIDRLTSIAELPPEHDERRVAYSYLAHPRLAGRDELIARLQAASDAALAGHGEAVVVKAPAGLGRSSLLEAAALQAQLAGTTVLRSQGDRAAGPFGLARKLTQLAITLYPDLEDLMGNRPSFHSYRPDGDKLPSARSPAEVAARHAEVVSGVQEILLELSRRSPTVIVVDDIHEADAESAALLASMAQDCAQHGLTLIVSALAGASNESPAQAKLEASAVVLSPTPLSEADTIDLVDTMFGGVPNSRSLASWLHEQSGGNPAGTLDLARLLLQRSQVRYTLGTFTLPHDVGADISSEDVSNAMLARLGDLSPHTHGVACLLSLQEQPLTTEQLACAAALSPPEVMLALEELASRSVITQESQAFSLSSPSLRAALQRTLTSARQKELHVLLARALLANPDGSLELGFAASMHLLRGGEETEAAELIANTNLDMMGGETAARWTELLEAVLDVFRRQGRSLERCLAVMIPLVISGFFGGIVAQRRHLDATIDGLATICGMKLATRLRPRLGGKLALVVGILYAALRRRFTPPRERIGTLPEMMNNFIGLVIAGVASSASAMDGATGMRLVAHLEPLSALRKDKVGYLLREYCLATAELGVGNRVVAAASYAAMLPRLRNPVAGLPEPARKQVYLGCLNGQAQAVATEANPLALELAEELGRDPFYAPHAESARVTYYGYRGERDKCELHRARAELLAMRGGTSWSAVAPLTMRRAAIAMFTHDPIGLVQAIAELDRLASVAPKLKTYKLLSEAWLAYLRGRPDAALELYERLIDTDEARQLTTWRADRLQYAEVLNACGQYTRAKAECLSLIERTAGEGAANRIVLKAWGQLALAEAGMGNHTAAAELSQRELADTAKDNPLSLGDAHQVRAKVALRARDVEAFEQHFVAMAEQYRSTENPSLIRRIDALLDEAQRTGVRAAKRTQSIPSEDDDALDAHTVLEELETHQRAPRPRDQTG